MRLLALLLALLPVCLGQLVLPECDDTSLTDYLVALIDALYANGLTSFEALITGLSETQGGYDLLQSWHTSQSTLTLLAPTDAAFQSAGLSPPFTGLDEWTMVNLMALHTLDGEWTYDKLPAYPLHGVAVTDLVMADAINTTVNTTASQVAVLQQAQDGGDVVQVKADNFTAKSWSGPLDLSAASQLWNLVVLPIDSVMPLPPDLSEALAMPTSSRSQNGFANLTSLLSSSSPSITDLAALTEHGFTIFAPVDDAWGGDDVQAALGDPNLAKNHYTTSYSLYSMAWYPTGQFQNLTLDSGASVNVVYNSTGSFVVMGDQSAQVLRSDVLLENGVLHIIDKVLLPPSKTNATATDTNSTSTSPSSSGTTSDGSALTGSTSVGDAISATHGSTTGSGAGATASAGAGQKDTQTSGADSTRPNVLAPVVPALLGVAMGAGAVLGYFGGF